MKKVKTHISRNRILKEIKSCLETRDHWAAPDAHGAPSDPHFDLAYKYHCQAEALVELLEVDDCGFTGGFNSARGQNRENMRTLRQRYDWLRKL